LDFTGLESLSSIGDNFIVDANSALSDVTALHNIVSVVDDFRVTDNTALLTEDAQELRDAIGTTNIGGTVSISGNK